jgi:nucleoside-diphosphate-sugar epimerase
MPIKAVARRIPSDAGLHPKGVTWFATDLLKDTALDTVLSSGDVVCNLAYMPDAGPSANVTMIDNIIGACIRCRASRLIHCSTATVAGATRAAKILESTVCEPLTPYEKSKWALEQRVLNASTKDLDVGILRPTAIVGPGGQNLLKLAISLQKGNGVANYLRASVFGTRPMHLVPVRDVAASLVHLASMPVSLNGNIYHVSRDSDPNNNFESIENTLLRALSLRPRKVPLLRIPAFVLPLLLGLLGRSDTGNSRIYDQSKLIESGFKQVDSVLNAVREFGEKIRDCEANCSVRRDG